MLVVKSLIEDDNKESAVKSKLTSTLKEPRSHSLGENFIGFQSLNISNLIFQDTDMDEAQDVYTAENDQSKLKGNKI